MSDQPDHYLWDSQQLEEKARLDAQAANPYTQRYLDALGIIRAVNGLTSMTGADKAIAQRHARRLWELGLQDVGGESVTRLEHGDPGGPFESAYARVMPFLVQYGGVSEKDAQRRLAQAKARPGAGSGDRVPGRVDVRMGTQSGLSGPRGRLRLVVGSGRSAVR